jgi:membrane protease YdiL (CAAX protease family)
LTEWSSYRVSGGLLAGMAAGFGEEVVFRGFIMSALAWGGFSPAEQVVGSALLFGLAHAGWGLLGARASARAALDAGCATAALGAVYSLLYLWSGRSLMPVIAAHAITDLIIQPALLETMIARQQPPTPP